MFLPELLLGRCLRLFFLGLYGFLFLRLLLGLFFVGLLSSSLLFFLGRCIFLLGATGAG